MKRSLIMMTVVLLISTGCAGPQPVQAPPTTNIGSGQASPPASASQGAAPLSPLPVAPVDYYIAGLDAGHQPVLPLTANACQATATGALQLQVSDVQWRPHPLAPEKFWAPSAVIAACNGGLTKSPEQSLALLKADGLPFGPFFFLPGLDPGQALGPVRLYASAGVSARAGALRKPALTLQAGAAGPTYPVLDPTGPEAPPASPILAQLRALALDSVTFSLDGRHQVELFLYDPDVRYTLTDMPSCASLTGQVDADGQHWSFWASIDGGTPVLAGEAGAYQFPGERGLASEATTVGSTTYVYLEQYSGCANAHVQHVFAYDGATGTVWRPQMKLETGGTMGAIGQVAADGKLHREYYNNAKKPGLHRLIYTWDAQAKLWISDGP